MDAVRKDVELLIQKEIESANKMFPLFSSRHEACAVIVEEIQEVEDELEKVNKTFKFIWNITKNDSYGEHEVFRLKNSAVSMAVEAIQVAAMAQKFIDSEKQKTDKDRVY